MMHSRKSGVLFAKMVDPAQPKPIVNQASTETSNLQPRTVGNGIRDPIYQLIKTIRPFIKVRWGFRYRAAPHCKVLTRPESRMQAS